MSTQSPAGKTAVRSRISNAGHSRRRLLRGFKRSIWRRWLVLLIMGFLIVTMEIREHRNVHQPHQTAQSLLEDPQLILEIVLFGSVFPLIAGFLLTYLDAVGEERDEAARALEERREFVKQVHDAANWQQLVQLVVSFPGSFVAATRAFLLVQRSPEESFKLVSSWYRQADSPLEPGRPILPELCQACAMAAANGEVFTMPCHRDSIQKGIATETRYCLWFAADRVGKAALVFDIPVGQPMSDRQLQLLNDLGTEVALAIANANLLYVGDKQQKATKQERQRIAHDLHDTLGQNISYLLLKLDQLSAEDTLTGIAEIQHEILRMRDVASDAYLQVRNTLEELRSENQSPLNEALCTYVEEVSRRTAFSIEVHNQGQVRPLDPHVQRQVLYITREALNNVEKHANARHVDLSLGWEDHELTLTIADDGIGFYRDAVAENNRYGLLIMDERARSLGGRLSVTSGPGDGTAVCLLLPVPGETAYDTETTKADQNSDR